MPILRLLIAVILWIPALPPPLGAAAGWILADQPALPESKMVAADVTVAPGKWSIGRLRNVPRDALLTLTVVSRGEVVLFVLDEVQLKAFPKVNDPVVMARIDGQFTASNRLPAGGHYYLLFWNKSGSAPVPVRFRAEIAPQAPDARL